MIDIKKEIAETFPQETIQTHFGLYQRYKKDLTSYKVLVIVVGIIFGLVIGIVMGISL